MIHIFDIIGSVFSFFSTLFYVLAMEICWPLGVVATVINATLYGMSGIYGDMSLEIIYFFLMFYGWYEWRFGGKDHKARLITYARKKTLTILAIIAVVGVGLVYSILRFYTSSHVPVMDSLTTVLSLIAQWMICMKMIQSWVVWFVVDFMYVILYFDRHLPVHSVLLLIYLGMAVVGYWRWRQLIQKQLKGGLAHG